MKNSKNPKEKANDSELDDDFKTFEFKKPITLQNILEILDGVVEMDGRMIVMTTNKRDIIDPALIRPGRIDQDLIFENPKRDLILYIFNYMYSNFTMEERMVVLNEYGKYIKDQEISTAKVINCFMYDDMRIGMEYLLSNYNYDIDSGYSDSSIEHFDVKKELETITQEFKCFNETENEIQSIDLLDLVNINDILFTQSSIGGSDLKMIYEKYNISNCFQSLFGASTVPQWIKFEFPNKVQITNYSLFMMEKYIMSGWNLVGINDDLSEEILDREIGSNCKNYNGKSNSKNYFKTIKIITTEKNNDNYAIVLYHFKFFGNIKTTTDMKI